MGITMTNLEKAHKINRILMRKLHSVCEEYGVTYFYDSGALIGAVRHHDFIPWDDDIDVASVSYTHLDVYKRQIMYLY